MPDPGFLMALAAFVLGVGTGMLIMLVLRVPAADRLWRLEAQIASLQADLAETQVLANANPHSEDFARLLDAVDLAISFPQAVAVHTALHDALEPYQGVGRGDAST